MTSWSTRTQWYGPATRALDFWRNWTLPGARRLSNATGTMAKPINLQLGWPSISLFPTQALQDASNATLSDPQTAGEALIYGPDAGYMPLRESLAQWLTDFYKPKAGPVVAEQTFVGNGASATLGIILQKYTDPMYTRKVFMVEPTYFLACPIFEDAGFEGRLRGIPEDDEGIDIDFLHRQLEDANTEKYTDTSDTSFSSSSSRSKNEKKYPKLYRYVIYAVPTFSNPSAKVMSYRRRKELVHLARKYDALVVTDDVYDMLRWPIDPKVPAVDLPPPPPRLVDIDRELEAQSQFGNAVSNGSFSKLVGPGARVSWVEGTTSFTFGLSTLGACKSGGSPGHLVSVFMNQMLSNRTVQKHIDEILVPTYRKRYIVMMEAIEKHLVPLGARVTTGQDYQHGADAKEALIAEAGGFFTYVTLPDDLQPAARIAKIALDFYALKVANGSMMVVAEDPGSLERQKTTFGRGLRLSWSWLPEEDIQDGVERLAQVMKDIRNGTVRGEPLDGNRKGLDDQ